MRRPGAFVQPVQIDVIEQQPALMRIHQGKRWAGYVFRIQSQGARNPLHQDGFPRPQRPAEQKDFAAGKLLSQTLTVFERLALVVRDPLTGGYISCVGQQDLLGLTGMFASRIERANCGAEMFANI